MFENGTGQERLLFLGAQLECALMKGNNLLVELIALLSELAQCLILCDDFGVLWCLKGGILIITPGVLPFLALLLQQSCFIGVDVLLERITFLYRFLSVLGDVSPQGGKLIFLTELDEKPAETGSFQCLRDT